MLKPQVKPACRKSDPVIQELEKELLIYDTVEKNAFLLNETSAFVWQNSDGRKTVGEIAARMSRKFRALVSEDFVWLALEQLNKNNLLEKSSMFRSPFEGLSRRKIIRRIGFASLIALPLVSALAAPQSINAGSGICAAGNCRCSNTTTSCNGTVGTVGGVTYINCFTNSGSNSACNCVGPFGPANGAGTGFKQGIGCRIS